MNLRQLLNKPTAKAEIGSHLLLQV